MPLTPLNEAQGGTLTPIEEAPQPAAANDSQQSGVWNDLVAGYQQSATGLMQRGKLPDVVLDPQHAKWYDSALESIGSTVSDLPEMGLGAALGSKGGPIGMFAGANAVPAEIRASLMKAYSSGDASSSADFLSRAGIVIKGLGDADVLKATAKAAAVGALTAGAGMGAGMLARPFGLGAETAATTAAQIGTMTVAPAALEGKMPEPQDFVNAAIVVGGLHVAGGVAGKMADIYTRTGRTPEQVVADAHADPEIAEQLKASTDTDIPTAYKPLAAQEAAKEVIPDYKAQAQSIVSAFDAKVGTPIPEGKLPNFENFKYMQAPEDVRQVHAQMSSAIADELNKARGSISWDAQQQKSMQFLATRAEKFGEDFVMPKTTDQLIDLSSKGQAAEAMRTVAAFKIADIAKQIQEDGTNDALEASRLDAVSMLRAWKYVDQGNGAELARALNLRKAGMQTRALADQVLENADMPADQWAKMVSEMGRDPDRISKFVDRPETFNDKLLQWFRFSLLSGATVYQVKGIGDMLGTAGALTNAGLRTVAAGLPGGSGEIAQRAGEFQSMWGAMGQGLKDGMAGMKSSWAATATPKKVFDTELLNKVTNLPRRAIEAETNMFRVFNERIEMSRMAAELAGNAKLPVGSNEYNTRISQLMANPTKEMMDSSVKAGELATYTSKVNGLGKLISDISNGKYVSWGGYVVPFAKVPINLTIEGIKTIPGIGALMDSSNADWKAGGALRDGVITRQLIGATVTGLAYSAAQSGILTGGGLSLSNEDHAGRRDSGIPDYSIKLGDKWYSYERIQPIGLPMMLISDLVEMFHQADESAKADIFKLSAAVLGHSIISMPYFQGIHNMMDALTSPNVAARVFDSTIGSFIPSILAQSGATTDGEKRRIDGLLDAVKSRIPGLRESLLPVINPLTGEPEKITHGLTPIETSDVEHDPVLAEAGRLGIGVPPTPKTINLEKTDFKGIEGTQLTPEQQNFFTSTAGSYTHKIMTGMIGSGMWGSTPDASKQKLFSDAIKEGRSIAKQQVLTPEQRESEMLRIQQEMLKKLQQ